jgi:hypothetical protein
VHSWLILPVKPFVFAFAIKCFQYSLAMSRAEGDAAVAMAEKKLKGSMFGLSKDPDGAVDAFKRACNNYKVAGCCATSSPVTSCEHCRRDDCEDRG